MCSSIPNANQNYKAPTLERNNMPGPSSKTLNETVI
jgi:hypothetical protein